MKFFINCLNDVLYQSFKRYLYLKNFLIFTFQFKMKFKSIIFEPPLYLAVVTGNVDIVKLLLSRDDIDVGKPKIS